MQNLIAYLAQIKKVANKMTKSFVDSFINKMQKNKI